MVLSTFSEEDLSVVRAVATAVIGVDTGFGGDIDNVSGIYKSVGDSWYVPGVPLPQIYNDKRAHKIRKLNLANEAYSSIIDSYPEGSPIRHRSEGIEKDLKDARTRWLSDDACGSKPLEELSAVADQVSNPWRKKYLKNLEKALRANLNLARYDVGLEDLWPHQKITEATVGFPIRFTDPKPYRDKLMALYEKRGYSLDKYEGRFSLVNDAWLADQEKIKSEDLQTFFLTEMNRQSTLFRKKVASKLNIDIKGIPLDRYFISLLNNVFFSGSSTHQGSRQEYAGHVEYNVDVERTKTEMDVLVTHEGAHHWEKVIREVLMKRGRLSPEAGIHTMQTPECTLSEGIGEIMRNFIISEEKLSLDQQIAHLRQDMDSLGRGNVSYIIFTKGQEKERAYEHFREEWGIPESQAKRIVYRWSKSPGLSMAYLPEYAIGPHIVETAFIEHGNKALNAMFCVTEEHVPFDIVTFKNFVEQSAEA